MTLERIAAPEGNIVEAGEMPEPSSRSAGSKRALRGLIGESRAMRGIRERLEKLALYNVPILLVGERGTGKEFVARTLHELTTPGGPFVKVRCSSTPDAGLPLLESAPNGTVFLDGIEDATGTLLDSLGALLDTRRTRPEPHSADAPARVRVVASLRHANVSEVALRPELLAPIAGFTLTLPPLRERLADVGLLATSFLENFARSHGTAVRTLTSGALAALRKCPWPGNVRQLRAVVEAAAIMSCAPAIERNVIADCIATVPRFDGPRTSAPAPAPVVPSAGTSTTPLPTAYPSLRDLERQLILSAWTDHENNLTRAASHLGIPRSTLRDKLRKYGVL